MAAVGEIYLAVSGENIWPPTGRTNWPLTRVDVRFGLNGFNLYVELKVDSTKTPVPNKQAYLKQSASYQVADVRLGFLLVLKFLPEKKTLAPHLSEALEVVEVNDGTQHSRYVAAFTLAGARTKPSNM